jgi:lipoprotein-anchoring transpeptidase ErfK/SrfK
VGGHAARPSACAETVRLAPAALLVLGATWGGPAPARSEPVIVNPSQQTAALLSAHRAFSRRSGDSRQLVVVRARRPITGERTVLPVVGRGIGADGLRWLRVKLPGRPNGHLGWIRQRATVLATTRWHLVVQLSKRRVVVYRNGRPQRVFRAVVGKPSTPTPRGEFFVEEAVELRPGDVGGPFALALSARSTVLQEFDGGPGQIALHGRMHVGGVLGTATSHGCVRLDDDAMRWLVLPVGPGVPVTITR